MATVWQSLNEAGENTVAETSHITFRHNKVYHANVGFAISAHGYNGSGVPCHAAEIFNNQFTDIGITPDTTNRGFQVLGELADVRFIHNTVHRNTVPNGMPIIADPTEGPQKATRIVIRDNIFGPGQPYSTLFQSGGLTGTAALDNYAGPGDYSMDHNVWWDDPVNIANYPATNQKAADITAIGFTNYLAGDYSLTAGSTYHNDASDGTDPGINKAKLDLATSGVGPATCTIVTSTAPMATSALAKPAYLSPVVEPDFKTKLTRISGDVGVAIPVVGGTWQNITYHNYSKDPVWSADMALMMLKTMSGALGAGVYLILDGSTYQPLYSRNFGTFIPGGESRWHPTLAGVVIGISGDGSVKHINVPANTATTKLAADGAFTSNSMGPFEGNPSYDGDRIVIQGTNAGNNVARVVSGLNGGSASVIQVINLTAVLTGALDWVSMSAGGGYVVAFGNFGGTDQRTRVWNANTGALVQSWDDQRFGHADLGIDVNGNEVMFGAVASGTLAKHVIMRQLSNGTITDLSGGNVWTSFNWHAGCRAQNRQGWGLLSVNDVTGALLDGEIAGFRFSATNQIERYGRHRSNNTTYDNAPKAVASPDGKRFCFASNWGNAAGPVQAFVLDVRDICP